MTNAIRVLTADAVDRLAARCDADGLLVPLHAQDAARWDAARIDAAFADVLTKIKALGDPWDQVLAAAPDSPPRKQAEAAVEALGVLAAELKKTGPVLGVLVQIPGI